MQPLKAFTRWSRTGGGRKAAAADQAGGEQCIVAALSAWVPVAPSLEVFARKEDGAFKLFALVWRTCPRVCGICGNVGSSMFEPGWPEVPTTVKVDKERADQSKES